MGSANDSVAKRSRLLFYNIMEKRSEYRKHAYDMVILMDVLDHIEKPGEFLEACFLIYDLGHIYYQYARTPKHVFSL